VMLYFLKYSVFPEKSIYFARNALYFSMLQDVSISERDNNQKTPLMLAMGRQNEDIVTYLYRKQSRYIKFTLR
jgi:hypothetical protein